MWVDDLFGATSNVYPPKYSYYLNYLKFFSLNFSLNKQDKK